MFLFFRIFKALILMHTRANSCELYQRKAEGLTIK